MGLDDLGADGPGGRDVVGADARSHRRADVVERGERQERDLCVGEVGVLLEERQVAGGEALQDQVAGREAAVLDLAGDAALEVAGRVVVGVGAVVVDLEVDADPELHRHPERLGQCRHMGAAVVLGAELLRGVVADVGSEYVDLAVLADLGERLGVDEAAAVGRPVELGVVHEDDAAIGGDARVHLEDEALLRGMPERGHRLLRVERLLLPLHRGQRPAAVGVDVRRAECRRGKRGKGGERCRNRRRRDPSPRRGPP